MKKIISILFLSCFLFSCPVEAQSSIWKNVPKVIEKRHTPPTLRIGPKPLHRRINSSGIAPPPQPPRINPTIRSNKENRVHLESGRTAANTYKAVFLGNAVRKHDLGPNGFVNIDSENRGFIIDKHTSSSSEKSNPEIEETSEFILSPPTSANSDTDLPKSHLDNLRMRVMKHIKQLNTDEMKMDEFFFIGLLIIQDEYGEYLFTIYDEA